MSTNMELITSVTVGSGGAASVTLPATGTIPQTYTDLKLVMSIRGSRSLVYNAMTIKLNGVATNQTAKVIEGSGSAATSYSDTVITVIANGSSATANTFGSAEVYIPNYTSSNYKSVSADSVAETNATTQYMDLTAGLWSSTAAITTISVESTTASQTILEGSTFYLYGISNVTSTTKATGGIVSSDGTYNYHMFPYSGTYTPTTAHTADILVIAGGGGGAYGSGGGGGGAGGLLTYTSQSLTTTGYTVTVGAGGTTPTTGGVGGAGGNSQFGSLTASVGGGYGGWRTTAAGSGGSGGGAGSQTTTETGGAGTSGQGFAGGNSVSNGYRTGGGGGAGAVGANATSSQNGAGGIGATSSLINAIAVATQTGQNSGSNYYYAGGGGAGGVGSGAGVGTSAGGLGGIGGGGRGALASGQTGLAGLPNTGGGGGSGWTDSVDTAGGQGGSGLVIIRYAI